MISPAVSWPKRQRKRDATIRQPQTLAAPKIIAAFPDMQVRMADAGRLDLDHNLMPGRFGVRQVCLLEGGAEIGDLEAFHSSVLLDAPRLFLSLARLGSRRS